MLDERQGEASLPEASKGQEEGAGAEMSDEALWEEVLWMLQDAGMRERGAHYVLAVAGLKRKGEDIQQQLDALRLAEGSLLQAARDEAQAVLAKAEPRADRDPKQARTWAVNLAQSVAQQAREAARQAEEEEPPFAATLLARQAQQQVAEALEAQGKAEAEAQAQAVAQAEHTLMLQAEAVAQAQAVAEAQAQALSEAQAQAEAVAEMQHQLQVEAQQAVQQQEVLEAAAAERQALRAQGLNSKKLPLRPGLPPCGFYMRKGECKFGKTCKWDHPEALMNAKGFPKRTGETPCAFYIRTGVCKFGPTCKFDHPEGFEPLAAAAALTGAEDTQLQLQALTQALTQAAAAVELQAGGVAADKDVQQLLALLSASPDLEAAAAAFTQAAASQ